MIPTMIEGPLTVRLRGDSPRAYHSTTRLDAYTCPDCGRTDLFAARAMRIKHPDADRTSPRNVSDLEGVRRSPGSPDRIGVEPTVRKVETQTQG